MYRDEILAIAEAVREAHKAGVLETRQSTQQYIASLEKAVRVLSDLAKAVQTLKTFPQEVCFDPKTDIADTVMLRGRLIAETDRCDSNIQELHRLRLAAGKAINDSGVQYLRRADHWSDGAPF